MTWTEPPHRQSGKSAMAIPAKKHVDRFYVVENLGSAVKKAGLRREAVVGIDWEVDPYSALYSNYFVESGHAVVSSGSFHALAKLFPTRRRTRDTGMTHFPALSLVRWGLRPQGGASHAAELRGSDKTYAPADE